MFTKFDERFLVIGMATLLAQGNGGFARLLIVVGLSGAITYYRGSCL